MFANLKKMLIIIPCMVIGLFLFANVSVSAADAVLLESKKVVVDEENKKENTYYFTSDKSWEFKASFDAFWDGDRFLKYRVVRPDGTATDWSSKQYYVNSGGKFSISDYTALSYTKTVDITKRVSVAPAATYYVDVEYYSEWLGLFESNQDKGETLKVVVSGSDDTLNIPTASIAYNKSQNKYTVNASILKDGVGYSIITDVEYYFSTEKKNNDTTYDFYKNKDESTINGALELAPASQLSVDFAGQADDKDSKYVYVIVTTGNGYSKIVEFSINDGKELAQESTQQSSPNTGTGLFDYDFGELILLVLVVVLIVSCALIITQKIVDYKKRLY